MKIIPSRRWAACALLSLSLALVAFAPGCQKDIPPPQTMTAEQLESALDQAFAGAKPDQRQLESDTVAALKKPDYSAAYLQLQKLAGQAGLSTRQNQVLSSGLLSVNQFLQTAQTQGDTNAAEALQLYRSTK
jgi:hypothetical protein